MTVQDAPRAQTHRDAAKVRQRGNSTADEPMTLTDWAVLVAAGIGTGFFWGLVLVGLRLVLR